MKEFIFTTMQGLKIVLSDFHHGKSFTSCYCSTPNWSDTVLISNKNLMEIFLNTELIYGVEPIRKTSTYLDVYMVSKSSIR